MVLLLVFMQLTRDLFAIAKFLLKMKMTVIETLFFRPLANDIGIRLIREIKRHYTVFLYIIDASFFCLKLSFASCG